MEKEQAVFKIQKVKCKHEKLEVEYEEVYTEDNYKNVVVKKSEQFIHPDLKYALSLLKVHVAFICELSEANYVSSIDEPTDEDLNETLGGFTVTGYSKGGEGESEGVCIIAQKILKTGQVLNLTTPFTKYEDETGENYEYGGELKSIIDRIDYEVDAYLFEQKWGFKQLSLDFEDGDSEPKEPKKRGRKKKANVEGFEEAADEIHDVEFEDELAS